MYRFEHYMYDSYITNISKVILYQYPTMFIMYFFKADILNLKFLKISSKPEPIASLGLAQILQGYEYILLQ